MFSFKKFLALSCMIYSCAYSETTLNMNDAAHRSFELSTERAKQVAKAIASCTINAPVASAQYAHGLVFKMLPHEYRNSSKVVRVSKIIALTPLVALSAMIAGTATSIQYIWQSMVTPSDEWQARVKNEGVL